MSETQRTRWIFGHQLGPMFDDGGAVLLIEARAVFGRAPMHRAKALLYLSAIRHRAAELGDRVEFHQVERYAEVVQGRDDLEVIDPTTYAARRMVRRHGAHVLPSRGFITSEAEFAEFAAGRQRLLMEDYYRAMRTRTGILMEGPDAPAGGRWNFDRENRNPPPKGAATIGLPDPWWPDEDDIDREARRDLARWEAEGAIRLVGDDGPRRFAATAAEARAALDDFVSTRLNDFGPFEDAMLGGDWTMAHSLLSAPLNLGLLDPREAVDAVVAEYEAGRAPLSSVEGFVRQISGWREWMWHLYWHLGEDYQQHNRLAAHEPVPRVFQELDAEAIVAACLHEAVDGLRRHGWAHHIQRLMVIGNWALQRGYQPRELSDWFVRMFVDGTDWVMPPNVIGMSQHADGGIVATKPYAAGGAYINRMSDHCGGCRYDPKVRVGENACPYTAGYWAFLDRVEPVIRGNHRMSQSLAGLRGLADREAVVAQEREREGF